ncbi:MAG: cation:proton antiporter [Gemmatimonadetes bacterium]|nr:cation:proton antiporter [Gemmatimonadota bacterium]
MNISIDRIEALLLVAALVAMAARRMRVPYSIGLVVAGIALSFVTTTPGFTLTKELIFGAFLPPLVFEAALFINWRELKADLGVIISLATVGVTAAAAVTAIGMHFFAGWAWGPATVFGALIAATDPVSVIATFKEAGVTGRLRLLVEAESLFNDSTAAILFGVAVAIALGSGATAAGISWTLVTNVGGGLLVGGAVASAILLVAGQTTDHLVEITFTTVAAYGSFLVAEHFHFSGVLATLVCGLLVGNVGPLGSISPKGREAVESFWEYAAFVVNSLIFILIGIREAAQSFKDMLWPIAIAIVLVTLGRAVAIYPLCALFRNSERRVSAKHQHVLFWGGLRGALALALALGLPDTMPMHDEILAVTFGVVAFSLFAQGLTMTPLLRRVGELPGGAKPTPPG